MRGVETDHQQPRGPQQAAPELTRGSHDEDPPGGAQLLRSEQGHAHGERVRVRRELVAAFDQPFAEGRHPLLRRQIVVADGERRERADALHPAARASRPVRGVEPRRHAVGHEPPLARVCDDGLEPGQDLLGPVHGVQVGGLAGRQASGGLLERRRTRGRQKPQPPNRQDRRRQEAEEFERASPRPPGLCRRRALGGRAVGHPHVHRASDHSARRFCTSSRRACACRMALVTSPKPMALP
jgi:hypothetical protein